MLDKQNSQVSSITLYVQPLKTISHNHYYITLYYIIILLYYVLQTTIVEIT